MLPTTFLNRLYHLGYLLDKCPFEPYDMFIYLGRGEKKMAGASCDTCAFNVYDDEDECYYCEVNMDEDDAVRLSQGQYKECPYYRNGDEYAVVRHQM